MKNEAESLMDTKPPGIAEKNERIDHENDHLETVKREEELRWS
jgi:hypothetical protein